MKNNSKSLERVLWAYSKWRNFKKTYENLGRTLRVCYVLTKIWALFPPSHLCEVKPLFKAGTVLRYKNISLLSPQLLVADQLPRRGRPSASVIPLQLSVKSKFWWLWLRGEASLSHHVPTAYRYNTTVNSWFPVFSACGWGFYSKRGKVKESKSAIHHPPST